MSRRKKPPGRTPLPDDVRRVHIGARVTPQTKAELRRLAKPHGSLGRLLDATFRPLSTPEP